MAIALRIVFDFSCPYCYITWNYIKKIKQKKLLADEWLTWNIHPEVGPQGMDIRQLVPTFNQEERRARLNALGQPVGAAPGDVTFVPDTRLALQAMEFAKEHGKASAWCDTVFSAHFAQGKNIGDKALLLELARNIDLPAIDLDRDLTSGKYMHILAQHDRIFATKGVEWVPTIFLGDKIFLAGAFTYEELEHAIESIT